MFHIVPAHVLAGNPGTAPSEQVRIALIGAGGRGYTNLRRLENLDGARVTMLCDVDWQVASRAVERASQAKQFNDFRVLFDKAADEIDAAVVATPDHSHALAAMRAIRAGKPVYCEKPLAHSVHEIRALQKAAREHGVATQLGNQGHSMDRIRQCVEWVRDGAIGEVNEVHAWRRRSGYSMIDKLGRVGDYHAVPDHLHYDLWLGPATAMPYSPLWVKHSWRSWTPFGSGAIGDWWCHALDPAYWALDLAYPESIHAEVKGYDPARHGLTFPPATRVTFRFPARDGRGPVKVVWHDGDLDRFADEGGPRPAELAKDRTLPQVGAALYGNNGTIVHGSHGAQGARIVPEKKMKAYAPDMPEPTIPRVPGGAHRRDWLQAIRESDHQAGSNFVTYGGPLTEGALLGKLAMQFPGKTLKYDAEARRFTNHEPANALLEPPRRAGWSLD